ncbi:hypothetical protein Btru_045968 [Bulinus truncatus]|nr:hypothetical protein Btru_045968 [Bulinus truncatus]
MLDIIRSSHHSVAIGQMSGFNPQVSVKIPVSTLWLSTSPSPPESVNLSPSIPQYIPTGFHQQERLHSMGPFYHLDQHHVGPQQHHQMMGLYGQGFHHQRQVRPFIYTHVNQTRVIAGSPAREPVHYDRLQEGRLPLLTEIAYWNTSNDDSSQRLTLHGQEKKDGYRLNDQCGSAVIKYAAENEGPSIQDPPNTPLHRKSQSTQRQPNEVNWSDASDIKRELTNNVKEETAQSSHQSSQEPVQKKARRFDFANLPREVSKENESRKENSSERCVEVVSHVMGHLHPVSPVLSQYNKIAKERKTMKPSNPSSIPAFNTFLTQTHYNEELSTNSNIFPHLYIYSKRIFIVVFFIYFLTCILIQPFLVVFSEIGQSRHFLNLFNEIGQSRHFLNLFYEIGQSRHFLNLFYEIGQS